MQPMAQDDVFQKNDSLWWDGGKMVKPAGEFVPRRLDTPLDKMVRRFAGRRSRTKTERRRGRYVQARPTPGKADDLALDATLRAAAPFQNRRSVERQKVAFSVKPGDYMRKVRVRRAANLILFLVDASWSMAVAERMAATKGAILSLLTDAYQRRDRVGLIVFQKDRATLILQPTNSVVLAQRAMENIPVGGKTPLSAGLLLAQQVLRREKVAHPDVMPLLIVLTDGAGNVSIGALPPQEEAYQIADQLAMEEHLHSVVVNMEHTAFDQGLARRLGDRLGAHTYTLGELRAESLYQTVREEMQHVDPGKSLEDRR